MRVLRGVMVWGALGWMLAVGGRADARDSVRGDVGEAVARAAIELGGQGQRPMDGEGMSLVRSAEASVARGEAIGGRECVFGVCGGSVREEMEGAARDVIIRCWWAMEAIDRESDREQEDAERLTIAQETVLPLRAARAATWLAGCAQGSERDAWARRAVEICEGVDAVTVWSIAERGVVLGAARVLMGEGERALEVYAGAHELIGAEEGVGGSTDRLEMEITLGTVLATGLASGVDEGREALGRIASRGPFVDERGVRDWELALLEAGVWCRVGMDGAGADAVERTRAVERSALRYGVLIAARDTSERELGVRRRDVYKRLAWAIERGGLGPGAVAGLPGIGAAAVASRVDGSDDVARSRAIEMLEAALVGMDVEHDRFGADVLFELGRLASTGEGSGEMTRAARAFVRFAELAPTDDRVGAALGAACAAGSVVGAGDASGGLYLRCLRAAVGHAGDVARIDTWRLELARVVMAPVVGDALRARWGAMLEASDALRGVGGLEARVGAGRFAVAMWLGAMDEVRAQDDEWRERVAAAARTEAVHVVESMEGLADPAGAALVRGAAAVLLGEALVVLGDPEGAVRATSDMGDQVGDAVAARGAAVRFAALVALGRVEEGFGALDVAGQIDRRRALRALLRVERGIWETIGGRVAGFAGDDASEQVERGADVLMRGVVWREGLGMPVDSEVRERAARALVWVGRAGEALEVIDREERAGPDLLVVRGEALLGEGEAAAAFDSFRRVGVALEPDRTGERAYWHAWARMLEVLESRNREGARSADIRREIRRLRTLESWGVFEDCVARIETVGREVGP